MRRLWGFPETLDFSVGIRKVPGQLRELIIPGKNSLQILLNIKVATGNDNTLNNHRHFSTTTQIITIVNLF